GRPLGGGRAPAAAAACRLGGTTARAAAAAWRTVVRAPARRATSTSARRRTGRADPSSRRTAPGWIGRDRPALSWTRGAGRRDRPLGLRSPRPARPTRLRRL